MGACVSDPSPEDVLEAKTNRIVNRALAHDAAKDKSLRKLLLLGPRDSGKSTILKQISSIYGQGWSVELLKTWSPIIHDHTALCMKALCDAAPRFAGPVQCPESLQYVLGLGGGPVVLDHTNVEHFQRLWADPEIQNTYDYRFRYYLPDSAEYFLSKLSTISAEGWIPSEEDVLRARVRTTGIVQSSFLVDGERFEVYDVGGQRNKRKKWIHCFQGVTAVLFVAAMNEYDMSLYEDETMNRMCDTLRLFEQICKSRWFTNTSIILFLNKKDMFAHKLRHVPLTVCPLFAEYKGPNTFEAGCELMREAFTSKRDKKIWTHVTCATDNDNVRVVFQFVQDIVMRQALDQVGLLG